MLQNIKTIHIECKYYKIKENIFSGQKNDAIVHSISIDVEIRAGVKLQFKQRFNELEVLKTQNKKVTEMLFLKQNNQWILYLRTKRLYHEKLISHARNLQ